MRCDPAAPSRPSRRRRSDPRFPLRLIGLESHSGYSTVAAGFWPFGISAGLIDRVRAASVVERHPTLAYLPMNAPEAADQIVSGIFPWKTTLPLDGAHRRGGAQEPARPPCRCARRSPSRRKRARAV